MLPNLSIGRTEGDTQMTNPLYLIEASFGRHGRAFIETDRDDNSRAKVIELIRSGEVNAIKVIEVCEDEGTVRDVTADILDEIEAMHVNEDFPEDQPREWRTFDRPDAADLQAAKFDHARDLRKETV